MTRSVTSSRGFLSIFHQMKGLISRRINKQHRLVYEVIEKDKITKVYRMWTDYE